MSRAERLLSLLEFLRRHRRPVSGQSIANELAVSLRTIYRDIQTLVAQGASIEGEAGLGFILRPGYTLPPLMFSDLEMEAIVLGARWVARNGDDGLSAAARNALAKITAVVPPSLRDPVETSGLLAGPGARLSSEITHLAHIRQSIQEETKVILDYIDGNGTPSRRVIWPIALAFFGQARVVAAWCEERQAFRHFQTGRIVTWMALEEKYPRRRRVLTREWRLRENIPEAI